MVGHASNVEVILLVFIRVVVVCLELKDFLFEVRSCVFILTSKVDAPAGPCGPAVNIVILQYWKRFEESHQMMNSDYRS